MWRKIRSYQGSLYFQPKHISPLQGTLSISPKGNIFLFASKGGFWGGARSKTWSSHTIGLVSFNFPSPGYLRLFGFHVTSKFLPSLRSNTVSQGQRTRAFALGPGPRPASQIGWLVFSPGMDGVGAPIPWEPARAQGRITASRCPARNC